MNGFTHEIQRVRDILHSPEFVRANFGGPRRSAIDSPWLRVNVRSFKDKLQFEYFDRKQCFARNHPPADVHTAIDELLALQFSSIHLVTATEETDVRISKKGKVFIGRRATESNATPHNRLKDLPLPEGESNRLLEAMGILGSDGRVRPAMRAKFTQINEFLKHLLHVIDDSGLQTLGRPIEILDAGCGSSHLTLAVHHFLNEKLRLPAHLLGVDVNIDVIRKSVERADRLGAEAIRFVCSKIEAVTLKPDMVIALHACDTATDAALAAAVKAEAKLILSVPCCHHHMNEQLKSSHVEVLRPILRHGILHERQADLVTDAFRALILRIHGYRSEVVEFTSPEHTARNLMIRAVKSSTKGDPQYRQELAEMKHFFGVTPYLEGLLFQ